MEGCHIIVDDAQGLMLAATIVQSFLRLRLDERRKHREGSLMPPAWRFASQDGKFSSHANFEAGQ